MSKLNKVMDSEQSRSLLQAAYIAGELAGQGYPLFYICPDCKNEMSSPAGRLITEFQDPQKGPVSKNKL
jgi:hypothetical protein